jgi:hypothetical protein
LFRPFWEKRRLKAETTTRQAFQKERIMAAIQMSGNDALGASDMDYPAHFETYRLFTSLVKWGTATVILILLLLAFFTL